MVYVELTLPLFALFPTAQIVTVQESVQPAFKTPTCSCHHLPELNVFLATNRSLTWLVALAVATQVHAVFVQMDFNFSTLETWAFVLTAPFPTACNVDSMDQFQSA